MEEATGKAGELIERLLDAVDHPGPQLRAVATTLLIKALDFPAGQATSAGEASLFEAVVASDDAAAMIDPAAAASEGLRLRRRLATRLEELSADHGEASAVKAMRDYLAAQVERWATRAVDDADNRRRAERFLAWADRPGQLEAAQRRGLFVGMDAAEFRRLADTRVRAPVTPETAVAVWAEVDGWLAELQVSLGDGEIARWQAAAGGD